MAKSFSTNDLLLLGYERVEELSASGPFRLFAATTTAGVRTITHHFLYLKDEGVTKEAISQAGRAVTGRADLTVVLPDKAVPPESAKAELSRIGPVFSHSDLIWHRLQGIFSDYVANIKGSVPNEEWFIQPRYAGEGVDPRARPDEDFLDFLCGKQRQELDVPDGNLLVITAPAGVGKTTLARHMVIKQAERVTSAKCIPIYVEASHWGKLQLQSISELWEIIRNSLTTFSSSISLREDLIEYALRQGWLSFIFDGFDELCAGRQSQFSATDVLQKLAQIASNSEARIVVTTRSLFWETEVTSTPSNVSVKTLAPFNKPQATRYFELRFSKAPQLRKTASELYSRLTEHTHRPETPGGSRAQLINTPICVAMIAEYVEQGQTAVSDPSGSAALSQLLRGLCERDKKRQKFVTPPSRQIEIFQELAVDGMDEFENDDLQILGFDDDDIRKGRTVDHVLLTKGREKSYRMRYDFLPPYFRAIHLAESLLTDELALSVSARKLITQEANGRGYVLEHLVQLLPAGSIEVLSQHAKSVAASDKELQLFFFHLLKLYLEDERPKDSARERTQFLLPNCFRATFQDGRLIVSGALIIGPVDRLDLRDVTFRKCLFRDVTFSKCLVDVSTSLDSCQFRGEFGVTEQTQQWRSVRLQDAQAEPPASITLRELGPGEALEPEAVALDALRLALDRFWHNGQLRRSMRMDGWNRGLLGSSQIAGLVLDALLRAGVIEKTELSSVKEGGLGVPVDSIPDIKQLMDNNQTTGRVKQALELLVAKLKK